MQQEDIAEIYKGKGILSRFKDQKNRKSNLFSIVQICLHQNYQQRKSAAELIQILLSKQSNKPNFMVYSIMLPNKKEIERVLGQSQIQQNSFNDQAFQNKQKIFTQSEKTKLTDFINKSYENVIIISQEGSSLILGVFNKTKNRESVLKIQKVKSKSQIIRSISIMRTKMPLVVELYEYYYLTLTQKDDFIVYELEKCSSDFNLAQCIRTDKEWDYNINNWIEVQCPVYSEYGMQKYRAPEQLKTHFSSKESDMFTLGICLCLLDNYDYLMPVYDNQCKRIQNQFKQPFSPLKNEQDLINRKSFIYLKAIKNILVYEAFSRKDLSEILKDFKQDHYSQENNKLENQNCRIVSLKY
ncbi:hypothetical protein ABPG73_016988, partial [Tetrahymena malaccensis]